MPDSICSEKILYLLQAKRISKTHKKRDATEPVIGQIKSDQRLNHIG